MHWPPWFLIFGILLLLLGTCHVDIGREIKDINNFTPSDRWLDAYHLSHVCPGTAMPPTSASPVDKQQMLKQLLVERKEAGCTHVYGNLVLDLTGRTLQNLWAGGGMAEFGFAYNQTHTVSGYVHLRLSNFPDEEAVDADKMVNLYGLSTIAGEELYPMMVKKGDKIEVIGCHLVIEYFAFGSNNDNMDLDRYVVGETLDLSNVRICSFRTKHNNADPSIPERDYTPDKYGIYEGKDNAQWSLGVRIKGVDKDGKLKMDQEGAGVGGFQSTSFAQDCTDKGLTSMISNYARPLQPPDGICCPEECAHGCFFETHQYIEGVGRWRCSKCRPGIDNKPRFWNQYSGKCEYCEHADRLGLVCNKIESEKCKLPLIKTNGECALECPLGETLNMKDGSCIKCPWSWQEHPKDQKKRFDIGNEGCDITCFVFGSLTALTTNLLQRKVPMNHTYYINTGNPAVDEKNVNNRRQCRILVGDIEVTQVTRWTQPYVDDYVRATHAVYGNLRFNNLNRDHDAQAFNIFTNTRQIVGNLQIQDVDKVESDPKYFTNFKKLGGEFTKVEPVPSSLSFEEKIMNAKKLAATEGLYWHSALFDGSGACSQFCGNNGCKSGASQASWGCVDCNVESFKIEEAGLFSCISECPEGYYATEKKECKRCHPNCVGGCSTSGTVFPGACNKCKVYVAKGDKFECKSVATEKRCDLSAKDSNGDCSGLMSGGKLIERMIANLKPFPEES